MEFESLLLNAVDRGLDVVGTYSRHVIYSYLERTKNLKREEIPIGANRFMVGLADLLGAGAMIIERTIIREMELAFHVQVRKDKLADVLLEVRKRSTKTSSRVGAGKALGSKFHRRPVQNTA